MAAAARPARQRRAPQQLYDPEARGMGFRHDSEADQAARAAGRGQQAKDEPGAAARGSSGSAGRSHAQRSTPAASGRATRRNTTLPDHGPLSMGTGTNVGPEPRSRAAGAQFDTPERYEMLMRFRLWRQVTKAGMAHHESLIIALRSRKPLPFFGSISAGARVAIASCSPILTLLLLAVGSNGARVRQKLCCLTQSMANWRGKSAPTTEGRWRSLRTTTLWIWAPSSP